MDCTYLMASKCHTADSCSNRIRGGIKVIMPVLQPNEVGQRHNDLDTLPILPSWLLNKMLRCIKGVIVCRGFNILCIPQWKRDWGKTAWAVSLAPQNSTTATHLQSRTNPPPRWLLTALQIETCTILLPATSDLPLCCCRVFFLGNEMTSDIFFFSGLVSHTTRSQDYVITVCSGTAECRRHSSSLTVLHFCAFRFQMVVVRQKVSHPAVLHKKKQTTR